MTDAPLLPHPVTGTPYPSPVPAGTGWPDDPATPATPVARTPAAVRRLSATDDLHELEGRTSVCAACPRLVRWREDVARDKRASFAAQPYWGRPIAGWGAPTTGEGEARIVVVGLAPAANGGNRTGRVFTGDSSGDWLFASLHRVGLATRERSEHAGDGQALVQTRMVATVRCAPPANKPTVGRARHLRTVDQPRARAAGPDAPRGGRTRCLRLGRRAPRPCRRRVRRTEAQAALRPRRSGRSCAPTTTR